jgi:hypothetical protein
MGIPYAAAKEINEGCSGPAGARRPSASKVG